MYSTWEGRARWPRTSPWAEQGARCVQQVMDKLHLSQKLLQEWQTTAQNWSFGSSKSPSSSSPSMTSCWCPPESKAWPCPFSFSYFGEVKDWYLEQKPLQRAHKPLRSADCKQAIKVKHLLKGCADMELVLPLEFVGQELWDDVPLVLSSHIQLLWLHSGQRKQQAVSAVVSTQLCTQVPAALLYFMTWK